MKKMLVFSLFVITGLCTSQQVSFAAQQNSNQAKQHNVTQQLHPIAKSPTRGRALKRCFSTMQGIEGGRQETVSETSNNNTSALKEITKKAKKYASIYQNVKDLLIRSIYIAIVTRSDYEDASFAFSEDVYKPNTSIWPEATDKFEFQQLWRGKKNYLTTASGNCYSDIYYPLLIKNILGRINCDLGPYPHIELARKSLSYLKELGPNTTPEEYHTMLVYLARFFYNFYPLIDLSDEELALLNNAVPNVQVSINRLLYLCVKSSYSLFDLLTHTYPTSSDATAINRYMKVSNRRDEILHLAQIMLPEKLYTELDSEICMLSKIY